MQAGLRSVDDEAMREIGEAFIEYGGIPNYSQQITIFGQLQDGFEILDAITDGETTGDGEAQRPAKEIRITSVEITKVP